MKLIIPKNVSSVQTTKPKQLSSAKGEEMLCSCWQELFWNESSNLRIPAEVIGARVITFNYKCMNRYLLSVGMH